MRPSQYLGGRTAALGLGCQKEVQRGDFKAARKLFGERNDTPDARRHQNAFPKTLITGAKNAACLCMRFGKIDAVRVQTLHYLWIALFEQRQQQMLGTHVIVVVVAALLLGRA